ncbi:MAG: class I SAM-dependent methyltransferase [Polyangiaceae bacterium]|nr:class I SAM-dependent methyltransferase [Polyangiaceae bacterium]
MTDRAHAHPSPTPLALAYLQLLRGCLTRDLIREPYIEVTPTVGIVKPALYKALQALLAQKGFSIVRRDEVTDEDREEGRGWPAHAETMMGLRRMEFLQDRLVEMVSTGVEGDFFEAGCWRGGGVIFMLAVLQAMGDTHRTVWAADSFAGYPPPTQNSHDVDRHLYERSSYFRVDRSVLESNVRRYGLYNDQLRILEGWFGESIPKAEIHRVSLLRIDVDGYEGVRDALQLVYPKLSVGGYVLIEDLRQPGAKRAVEELFNKVPKEEVLPIAQRTPCAVYWKKTHSTLG